MPRFSYIVRDREGKRTSGKEDSLDQEELVKHLQAQGMLVISVQPVTTTVEIGAQSRQRHLRRSVTVEDRVLFARQLATILDSGVTLIRSLDVLSRQVESQPLYDAIKKVSHDVEEGLTLRDAIARHPKIFSDLWVNLVETGEVSGNLPNVLGKLASYLEERARFSSKIISALVYPVMLLFVAIGAVGFFILRVVPTFAEIFTGFGMELSLLTKIVIAISKYATKVFFPTIVVFIILFYLFKKFKNTPAGKQKMDALKFKLPLFGNFFKIMSVERFVSEVAILLESSVPLLYTLEITERAIGNKVMEAIVKDLKENVRQGRPLSETIMKSGFFAPMVIQMITVGEEIGELAPMFKRIADYYQDYLDTFTARLVSLFEPMMLVFMGGVIGTLVLATFMPIFKLATLGTGGAKF